MVRFDIRADKTALLIVDMQNAFVKQGSPLERVRARELVPRLNKLIQVCHKAGILIIFTCHVFREDRSDMGLYKEFSPALETEPVLIEGTPDAEIYHKLQRQKRDIIILKRTYSAFLGTELDLLLRVKEIDTLIIGGVDTLVCCESTARDARHRNYKVIFLSDGTATSDQPDVGWGAISADEAQRFILTVLALRYAEVLSIEEVLRRIHA